MEESTMFEQEETNTVISEKIIKNKEADSQNRNSEDQCFKKRQHVIKNQVSESDDNIKPTLNTVEIKGFQISPKKPVKSTSETVPHVHRQIKSPKELSLFLGSSQVKKQSPTNDSPETTTPFSPSTLRDGDGNIKPRFNLVEKQVDNRRNYVMQSFTRDDIYSYILIVVIFVWCTALAMLIGPNETLVLYYIGTGMFIASVDGIYCMTICWKRSKERKYVDRQNTNSIELLTIDAAPSVPVPGTSNMV